MRRTAEQAAVTELLAVARHEIDSGRRGSRKYVEAITRLEEFNALTTDCGCCGGAHPRLNRDWDFSQTPFNGMGDCRDNRNRF